MGKSIPCAGALVTYTTARVATIHLEPRGTVWTTLPADSIIQGCEVSPPGWVAWVRNRRVAGYLHRGDLDAQAPP